MKLVALYEFGAVITKINNLLTFFIKNTWLFDF